MSIPIVQYEEELPAHADLVVVGGGIVGCATAFFASRAGLDVVVLERRLALATLTTPASTGAFRLQFDNPDEIALVREGIALFDDFAERSGLRGWDLALRHGGYLFCSLTDATFDRSRRLVERQRGWGLTDVELLSGDEARYRWPWLSAAVLGGRYRAADGWLDPKRLAIGYARASRAAFCTGTEVTGFRLTHDGSRLLGVQTGRGEIAAEAAVIAAGPFSAQVAALAGLQLEIVAIRRQKLVMPDLPAIPADAPMTIEEETAAHWRPALGGCLALWTDADTPASEPSDALPIDPGWAFELLDPASDHALARVAPFWADVWREGSVSWYLQAGQYEMTPDRRPYLGPGGPQGLHVNGGYSGHGIMASAAGSRLVVDLLTGMGDPSANPLRIDRPMTAREHDIL
ncbi:MAG: FAD-binding oxidoreductase [Chloroflexota bacterium]|nr:FAD-binding oxidoreductase [Chloroflexota bacterium]